jgi:hypothetical protein
MVTGLRQRFRRGSSGFDAEGTMLLLAGSGERRLAPALARMDRRYCWPALGKMG